MPFTIPAEVYIEFEEALGTEKAKKIVKAFETIIDAEIVNKWAQTKFELRDELLKEFVTKKEFETKIESLRAELSSKIESARTELKSEIESVKTELDSKIESVRAELDSKIESVRAELGSKIELVKTELDSKIESVRVELTSKIDTSLGKTKTEIREDFLKEFVTKNEFETKINSLKIELSKEIENAVLKIEKRFTILFLVLLFTVIFLNRGALEFILKILKVI